MTRCRSFPKGRLGVRGWRAEPSLGIPFTVMVSVCCPVCAFASSCPRPFRSPPCKLGWGRSNDDLEHYITTCTTLRFLSQAMPVIADMFQLGDQIMLSCLGIPDHICIVSRTVCSLYVARIVFEHARVAFGLTTPAVPCALAMLHGHLRFAVAEHPRLRALFRSASSSTRQCL